MHSKACWFDERVNSTCLRCVPGRNRPGLLNAPEKKAENFLFFRSNSVLTILETVKRWWKEKQCPHDGFTGLWEMVEWLGNPSTPCGRVTNGALQKTNKTRFHNHKMQATHWLRFHYCRACYSLLPGMLPGRVWEARCSLPTMVHFAPVSFSPASRVTKNFMVHFVSVSFSLASRVTKNFTSHVMALEISQNRQDVIWSIYIKVCVHAQEKSIRKVIWDIE